VSTQILTLRGQGPTNLISPIASVIPGAKGEVLAILARTSEELTGNVIATLAGGKVSQSGANKALKKLVADGLVLSRPAGKAILYSLNRDHVAARSIVELSELRSALMTRVRELVTGWHDQPVAVAWFGSTARGHGSSTSDIDLLVIRPDAIDQEHSGWATQAMELTDLVRRWSGNACEILEYPEVEFAALVLAGDTLVENLRTDAIGLIGRPPRELTRPAR
jgi:predicted nucleotidyltransferase